MFHSPLRFKYGKCHELNIIKNICKYDGITIYKMYDFNLKDEIKDKLI